MKVSSGSQAVSEAKKWLGTPYQWGGGHGGPVPVGSGVDCSGLVNQVFGISGTTYTQESMGTAVANLSSALPGDLIFFGPLAPNEAFHVGIYTGSGLMIDAPHTGTNVRYDTVANFGQIAAIRRLVPSNGGGGGSTTGVQYTYAQLEAVWIQAGGSAATAAVAAAIAMAESGGNASASNTNSNNSTDRGLWQINSTHGSQSSFDVMTNARAAVAISNQGTNWRPWCTAYSDGACGSKGGCYQCPGSPYLKYYNTKVQPDYSAPINATNAAANEPTQSAVLTGFSIGGVFNCVSNPEKCIAGVTTSYAQALVGDIIKTIMHSILNPIIQPIAGIMGLAAGGVIMLGGGWMLLSQTKAGQSVNRTAFSAGALALGQPEFAAAGNISGGLRNVGSTQRFTARSNIIAGREQQRQAGMRVTSAQASQQRIQEMNTQQLLDLEAAAYREWLRRTRPGGPRPSGPGGRPQGGPPQQGLPRARRRAHGTGPPRAIPARSRPT